MSYITSQEREGLIKLRDEKPQNYDTGICNSTHIPYTRLMKIFQQWPEYSGREAFPVPAPDGSDPGDYYITSDNTVMWNPDHPYGAARLRLLDFLIAYPIEEESQNQSNSKGKLNMIPQTRVQAIVLTYKDHDIVLRQPDQTSISVYNKQMEEVLNLMLHENNNDIIETLCIAKEYIDEHQKPNATYHVLRPSGKQYSTGRVIMVTRENFEKMSLRTVILTQNKNTIPKLPKKGFGFQIIIIPDKDVDDSKYVSWPIHCPV